MIRLTLLTLMITTVLASASHAAAPGTGTALDALPSAALTAAEKKATDEANAERVRMALKAAQDQNAKDQVEITRLKAALLAKPAPDQPVHVSAPEPPAMPPAKRVTPHLDTATEVPPSVSHPAPGTRLEAYPGGPVLIALKTGSFIMGSDRNESESPPHQVRVAQAFAMGETELSFAQWDACVNDTHSALRCKYKPQDEWGRGDQPVMNVSHEDIVQQYLPWLNDKTRATPPYRLPTEAEWVFAARAGGKGYFSLGRINSDKLDSTKANYDASHSYAGSPKGQFRGKTMPVKSFEANAFGIYNMHGNVLEWTADCFAGERLTSKKSEEKGGCSHILRGGSWSDNPASLLLTGITTSGNRNNSTGFRLTRTLLP